MKLALTFSLFAGALLTACADLSAPPNRAAAPLSLAATGATTVAPNAGTQQEVASGADRRVPELLSEPKPSEPQSVEEGLEFRAEAAVRGDAIKQVVRELHRHLQSELDPLAQGEAAWCREHLTLTREQLFFTQLSLGSVAVSEQIAAARRPVVSAVPAGFQAVVNLPKGLPTRLLFEHLRGLESYVASASRAAFRTRYPVSVPNINTPVTRP